MLFHDEPTDHCEKSPGALYHRGEPTKCCRREKYGSRGIPRRRQRREHVSGEVSLLHWDCAGRWWDIMGQWICQWVDYGYYGIRIVDILGKCHWT